MKNDAAIDGFEETSIVQAHEFFKLQIRQWLGRLPEHSSQRAEALVTALLGLLRVVVIDLQSNDDPNIIFETLNARGTPLLASDLIKNSILHDAQGLGLGEDKFYKDYWIDFDQTWWRQEIRQGRLFRPRIDVFLNYWLIMRLGHEVQSSQVFTEFGRYVDKIKDPITHVAADIKAISKSFRELEEPGLNPPEATFLYRWRVVDAGVSTPVILWLFSNRNRMDKADLGMALCAIESYLIRRMLCRMTTKDYNRIFLELVSQLSTSDPSAASAVVTEYLSSQTADSRVWPTDMHIREALRTLPLYQLLTRGRLRMVLESLEGALRTSKAETLQPGTSDLTIEHVMPQSWEQHWPLSDPDDPEAADARRRLVHTMGNLTLVTDKLNPALSNSAWGDKRSGLNKHSVLYLNKDILDGWPERWDNDSILARSKRLADLTIACWPHPARRLALTRRSKPILGSPERIGMADQEPATRSCPFCKEVIMAEALRCKHCQATILPAGLVHHGICPYCKESIHPEAIRCKHCRANLAPRRCRLDGARCITRKDRPRAGLIGGSMLCVLE